MMPEDVQRESPPEGEAENRDVASDLTQPVVPKIDCREKIIICLDLTWEMNSTSVLRAKFSDRTIFQFVQMALGTFVKSKLGLNRKHLFALVTLEDRPQWFQDFTGDVNLICDTLHHLAPTITDDYKALDMTSLFEVIDSHVALPVVEDIDLPPQNVVRMIMIYGRSHGALPTFSEEGKQIFDRYMASPYFFFDLLYVHELPDVENNCEEVYEAFCKLDEKEDCLMLEVSRSATRLFDHMAKLLAHPLQRPRQQESDYKLVKQTSSDSELDPEQT